ncbi:MAG: glycosyltransferase [Deltaproteobacteria bacterium]|jgi:glycosyltransferase involved in cell wall biosynthesis|nr:glycosyltransferase [Deltaproteobacteria bacterium]
MSPNLSIILPCLNHIQFLPDRIESIFSQTFKDWECIIIDGYSDDGSWEYLNEITGVDDRFRLFQEPRNGPYDAWNKGILHAQGKYIYIATSDDSMDSSCLEIMLNNLEANSQCHIAHCCLKIINEGGQAHKNQWSHWEKTLFLGDLINKYHIRYSPHDVFMHGGWSTVYTSVTQLLIKRSLFDLTGLFRCNLGSIADFEWGVRASLISNILHIPKYLATWRLHSKQLSDLKYTQSVQFPIHLCDMIEMAYQKVKHLSPNISDKDIHNIQYIYRRQFLMRSFRQLHFTKFIKLLFKHLKIHRSAAIDFLVNFFSANILKRINPDEYIKSLIIGHDSQNKLIKIINE